MFLHMEFQQPDDKTGDAAAAGGPDQHGDPAVQSPINVGGLPLSGSGEREPETSSCIPPDLSLSLPGPDFHDLVSPPLVPGMGKRELTEGSP